MHQFLFVSSHAWHILLFVPIGTNTWVFCMHYAIVSHFELIIGFSTWINYNEEQSDCVGSTWWFFSHTFYVLCGLRKEHLARKKDLFANVLSLFVFMRFTHMSKPCRKIAVKKDTNKFQLILIWINNTDEQHLLQHCVYCVENCHSF